MTSKAVIEGIRTRYLKGDGKIAARSWQNGCDRLARHVDMKRDLTPRKGDFAPLGQVPDIVREDWRRKGLEDLLRGDTKALEKYFQSSEGRVWSLRKRGRSRAFSFGGI